MRLYHGTTHEDAKSILKEGIILEKCQEKTDFGQGFYLTDSLESAVSWANRRAMFRKSKPAIISYNCDTSMFTSFRYRTFEHRNEEWAQFIINNRNGLDYIDDVSIKENNINKEYEIVKGYIADGSIINLSRSLLYDKRCVNSDEIALIINDKYPLQYSFHSNEVLALLQNPIYNDYKKGGLRAWKN